MHGFPSSVAASVRPGRAAAFTLLELLIATTIFGLASVMTFAVFIASLKRAHHTELALKSTAELRYATDVLSQAVRSAPLLPTVSPDGLKLYVAPKDLGSATVLETTWIDSPNGVKGSKANQRMLHVSNVTVPAVATSVWKTANRPASALSAADMATYFIGASALPVTDLNDLFASGDILTIPATAYGPQVQKEINQISNNPGNKTLTLTDNLDVDVPNGTRITATSGRRLLFQVVASGRSAGELRFYPDHRDTAHYAVLARSISPSPLSNPADAASSRTVPFTIVSGTPNTVLLNLQNLPAGTTTGRTVQGVISSVFTRTDSTSLP